MSIYPDTSFLFSRFLTDAHSADVDQRMQSRPRLFVTPFHRAELANAIFQQVFLGRISLAAAGQAYQDFETDCSTGVWELAPHEESAYARAVELAQKHAAKLGTRTLDTLHVAAALELGATAFWTFDQRQARLAEAAGLAVA